MVRLALYQPEIPQNTGTLLRLGACLGVGIDLILPCSFALSDRQLKRAGMDYIDHADYMLHDTWDAYKKWAQDECSPKKRLILLDTKASLPYTEFDFTPNDCLILGREGDGVSEAVYHESDHQVLIPMKSSFRSLNVAISAAMVLGEALRQTQSFFKEEQAT